MSLSGLRDESQHPTHITCHNAAEQSPSRQWSEMQRITLYCPSFSKRLVGTVTSLEGPGGREGRLSTSPHVLERWPMELILGHCGTPTHGHTDLTHRDSRHESPFCPHQGLSLTRSCRCDLLLQPHGPDLFYFVYPRAPWLFNSPFPQISSLTTSHLASCSNPAIPPHSSSCPFP